MGLAARRTHGSSFPDPGCGHPTAGTIASARAVPPLLWQSCLAVYGPLAVAECRFGDDARRGGLLRILSLARVGPDRIGHPRGAGARRRAEETQIDRRPQPRSFHDHGAPGRRWPAAAAQKAGCASARRLGRTVVRSGAALEPATVGT